MRWTRCFVCSLFSRQRQRERCPTSVLPGTTQPTTVWLCHQAQCSWCVHPKETGSSRFTSAPIYISEAPALFTARSPGQVTHLRSAPGHVLYQAPLRCEQRAGCRPKGTSSGDSSPFLIDTTSSIASISLLLHGMARL